LHDQVHNLEAGNGSSLETLVRVLGLWTGRQPEHLIPDPLAARCPCSPPESQSRESIALNMANARYKPVDVIEIWIWNRRAWAP